MKRGVRLAPPAAWEEFILIPVIGHGLRACFSGGAA